LANLARGRLPAAMGKGKWGRVPKPNPERQSSVRFVMPSAGNCHEPLIVNVFYLATVMSGVLP
jgi:hypothetical protein